MLTFDPSEDILTVACDGPVCEGEQSKGARQRGCSVVEHYSKGMLSKRALIAAIEHRRDFVFAYDPSPLPGQPSITGALCFSCHRVEEAAKADARFTAWWKRKVEGEISARGGASRARQGQTMARGACAK